MTERDPQVKIFLYTANKTSQERLCSFTGKRDILWVIWRAQDWEQERNLFENMAFQIVASNTTNPLATTF